MKTTAQLFTLLMTTLLLTSCRSDYLQRQDRIVFHTIHHALDDVQEKYSLSSCKAAPCVHHVAPLFDFDYTTILDFHGTFLVDHGLEKDDAREMVLTIAHVFLARINGNKPLRSYLDHFPFNVNDLNINISVPSSLPIAESEICRMKLEKGIISYSNKASEKYTECYADALQIAEQKNPNLTRCTPKEKEICSRSLYPALWIPEKGSANNYALQLDFDQGIPQQQLKPQ